MYIFWCDLQHDCTLFVFDKVHGACRGTNGVATPFPTV